MDMAARVFYPTEIQEEFVTSPIFINSSCSWAKNINDFFKIGEYLSPEESVTNQLTIINYFLRKQPQSIIFFLCFPYSTSQSNLRRLERGRIFAEIIQSTQKDSRCIVVPPPDIPQEFIKNWAHFDKQIYSTLAGFIHYSQPDFRRTKTAIAQTI